MLIKYKNKMITLRDLCIELKINYYKRSIKHKRCKL